MEEALIGACLAYGDVALTVLDRVQPDHFRNGQYRAAWQIISAMAKDGADIDLHSFRDRAARDGLDEELGPHEHFVTIATECLSPDHVGHYASRVLEEFGGRVLLRAANRAREFAIGPGPVHERYSRAFLEISGAGGSILTGARRGPRRIGEAAPDYLKRLDEIAKADGVTGMPTGLSDLDRAIGGLVAGDLIIIAGRPGMGKTALALGLAEHVASLGHKAFIYSGEMTEQQLFDRLVSARVQIDNQLLRSAQLTDDEWSRVIKATHDIGELPIVIDERGGQTASSIISSTRVESAQGPVKLLVVDYIQLLGLDPSTAGMLPAARIGAITAALKSIAKELGMAVVALSQLTRTCEQRENKRPQMSDLKYSGDLEGDADIILLVYRDEYYYGRRSQSPGIAEINIAKNRNGPTTTVYAAFRGSHTRFENAPENYCPPEVGAYNALAGTGNVRDSKSF